MFRLLFLDQVHRFEYNDSREAYFIVFTKEFLERSSISSSLMQRLTLYNYHLYPPVLQLSEDQIEEFHELVLRIQKEYDAQVHKELLIRIDYKY